MTAPGLTYDTEVRQGLVPEESGACVLFLEWDTAPTATNDAEPDVPQEQRRATR
ncbi:MAG TPA: hypothetical protein VLQ92_11990 [Candidatus Limnocylindrales bacterium]|nr:hypothetical protein [Candidatus Limnocylindrales bacterium]